MTIRAVLIAAFCAAVATASRSGFYAQYYDEEDPLTSVKGHQFRKRTPDAEDVVPTLDLGATDSCATSEAWDGLYDFRDHFYARFTTKLTAPATGVYTFYLAADEGARMTIDGTTVIPEFTSRGSGGSGHIKEATGTMSLTKGKAVNVIVDYFEADGTAALDLRWSNEKAGIGKTAIRNDYITCMEKENTNDAQWKHCANVGEDCRCHGRGRIGKGFTVRTDLGNGKHGSWGKGTWHYKKNLDGKVKCDLPTFDAANDAKLKDAKGLECMCLNLQRAGWCGNFWDADETFQQLPAETDAIWDTDPDIERVERRLSLGSNKACPFQAGRAWDGVTDFRDHFAVKFEGQLTPTDTGTYRFSLNSDDGSRLILRTIDPDTQLPQMTSMPGDASRGLWMDLLDDGRHAMKKETSQSVYLTEGESIYIRVDFFELNGGAGLVLSWICSDCTSDTRLNEEMPVPADVFSRLDEDNRGDAGLRGSFWDITPEAFGTDKWNKIRKELLPGGDADHPGLLSWMDACDKCPGADKTVQFDTKVKLYNNRPDIVATVEDINYSDLQKCSHGRFKGVPKALDAHYAAVFTGYIDIPLSGTYTLQLQADDGAAISIGGKQVIANDGLHGLNYPFNKATGDYGVVRKVHLKKGRKPLLVRYFQADGDAGLLLQWEGPGMGKAPVPSSALSQDSQGSLPGLIGKYYNFDATLTGKLTKLPAVASLQKLDPDFTRVETNGLSLGINYACGTSGPWAGLFDLSSNFASVMTGYIRVKAPQPKQAVPYKFFLTASDGARLYINNKLVVDNDGEHSLVEKQGQITLKGCPTPHSNDRNVLKNCPRYKVRIEFWGKGKGNGLLVKASAKSIGLTKNLVPGSWLSNTMDPKTDGLVAKFFDITDDVAKAKGKISFSSFNPPLTRRRALVNGKIYSNMNFGVTEQCGANQWSGLATFMDNFMARFTGKLNVPDDGMYNFRVLADDGATLYIDGKLVVDNDGLHSAKAVDAQIPLTKGSKDIKVMYFEKSGEAALQVFWNATVCTANGMPTGCEVGAEPAIINAKYLTHIPFWMKGNPPPAPGLFAEFVHKRLDSLPSDQDFSTAEGKDMTANDGSSLRQIVDDIDFGMTFSCSGKAIWPGVPDGLWNNFGARFGAKLRAPRTGDYYFYLKSHDGATLFLNGKKIIDNDGEKWIAKEQRTDRAYRLSAEEDAIVQVFFFSKGAQKEGASLQLYWANKDEAISCQDEGCAKRIIPSEYLTPHVTGIATIDPTEDPDAQIVNQKIWETPGGAFAGIVVLLIIIAVVGSVLKRTYTKYKKSERMYRNEVMRNMDNNQPKGLSGKVVAFFKSRAPEQLQMDEDTGEYLGVDMLAQKFENAPNRLMAELEKRYPLQEPAAAEPEVQATDADFDMFSGMQMTTEEGSDSSGAFGGGGGGALIAPATGGGGDGDGIGL